MAPRARTITVRQIHRDAKRRTAAEVRRDAIDTAARPQVRGDCRGREFRCPWVGCKFHLYLDVNDQNGSIKLNHPSVEPGELPVSCALLVAEMVRQEGELLTLEAVGLLMNMTRERVRQIDKRVRRRLSLDETLREEFDE